MLANSVLKKSCQTVLSVTDQNLGDPSRGVIVCVKPLPYTPHNCDISNAWWFTGHFSAHPFEKCLNYITEIQHRCRHIFGSASAGRRQKSLHVWRAAAPSWSLLRRGEWQLRGASRRWWCLCVLCSLCICRCSVVMHCQPHLWDAVKRQEL